MSLALTAPAIMTCLEVETFGAENLNESGVDLTCDISKAYEQLEVAIKSVCMVHEAPF